MKLGEIRYGLLLPDYCMKTSEHSSTECASKESLGFVVFEAFFIKNIDTYRCNSVVSCIIITSLCILHT